MTSYVFAATSSVTTFKCQVTGGMGTSTVWTGTAFKCASTRNAIVFLYNRLDSVNKTCNDGGIVGKITEVHGNNYTSQVMIILSPFLIGKTVECRHDNGTVESLVEKYTIEAGGRKFSTILMSIL